MAIPKFEDFLYPFMQHLMEKDSNKADMITALSDHFNISDEDRQGGCRSVQQGQGYMGV